MPIAYTLTPTGNLSMDGGTQMVFTRTGGDPLPDGFYTVEFATGSYRKFAIGTERPNLLHIRASNGVMRFATPWGPPGIYTLTLRSVSGNSLVEVLSAPVTYVRSSFYSKTYRHRKWFVSKFATGARSVEDEP